jgi:preprotein translocase subunit YajC
MNDLINLLPLITVFIIFYALLYIPQRRRNKKHKQFVTELKIGDNVITESGIHGRVTAINTEDVTLVLKKGEIIINKSYIQQKP